MKSNMKKIRLVLMLAVGLLSLAACGKSATSSSLLTTPIEKDASTMGTMVKVIIYDKGKENAAENALKIAYQYNELATVNQSGSEIDAINAQAGVKPVQVQSGVFQLIKDGLDYS